MRKFGLGKKLIAMLGIALMFLQYMVVPQYANTENIKGKISVGNNHSAWIDEQGRLWMWGSNSYGQIGNGEFEDVRLPIVIKEDTKFDKVSLGDDFTGAIDENGNLWMWGRNTYGELGTGTTDNSSIPVNISELMDGKKFVDVSLGGDSSAAIAEDGKLFTWGSNLYGELGNGTTRDSETPGQILEGEDITFVQVNSGKSFKSAIDETGKLWIWGSNTYGQLGDGTFNDTYEPKVIMGEKIIKRVGLGKDSIAVIDIDGNLYAWGENTYGQLGTGTTNDSNVPVQIMNGTKFASVDMGNLHSVAVAENGDLYTWGINEEYQLGNNSTQDSSTPIKLETNAKFIDVSAGDAHTLAMDEDKDVWTWGNNNYHQLGYDGEGHVPIPITKRKVTFKNYDGTVLLEKWVKYGSNAVYDGDTPQKTATGYNYTFTGWDQSLENVVTNLVCVAQFEETKVTYQLTVNPGDNKYTGDTGSTEKITAPEVTITYNYNGSGQENQEIKAQFNKWMLEKTDGGNASGTITNVVVNPVTYTYGEGNDTLTACYRPIMLQTPTRDGYEFGGWYAHETCQEINRVGDGRNGIYTKI